VIGRGRVIFIKYLVPLRKIIPVLTPAVTSPPTLAAGYHQRVLL
jgi:hypothetical protein